MTNALAVFIGGGIGALSRYWLTGAVYRVSQSGFPYGTLLVNVLGCLFIGILMSSAEQRFLLHPTLRLFLAVGILGGFTTFSSFSYETIALLRDGEVAVTLLNIGSIVFICLLAAYVGTSIAKLF